MLSNGTYGIIQTVKAKHYNTPQTTYNFEVEDFHSYYVGNGVLVHNQNCAQDIQYSDLPDDVKSAYDQYSKNGWKGNFRGQTTNAGGKWLNSQGQLPIADDLGNILTYREFDVGMSMPRGASRFVVSNQMTIYYTPDHYTTFFRIVGG